MHLIDYIIFVVYMIAMLGVGLISSINKTEGFYVSGRNMNSWHIGLLLSATDVGGGFQLAGGLGFTMGISGLDVIYGTLGAWLSAVYLFRKLAIWTQI
jgi:SSS family solute:Na+ symporter